MPKSAVPDRPNAPGTPAEPSELYREIAAIFREADHIAAPIIQEAQRGWSDEAMRDKQDQLEDWGRTAPESGPPEES